MPLLILLLAYALAAYTQLTHLTAVPGLHFDEAWQGLYAHRILNEAGFFPFTAMNSYTSPVLHYLLAGVFKLFGPSLAAMRGAYAAMNLASLALIMGFLAKIGRRPAAVWFALLWALLPLSVHDHRFYVEMTGFHGLCFASLIWGFALWRAKPQKSFALILISILAGTYSHILFIATFAGAIVVLAKTYPREFTSSRSRTLIAVTSSLLLPLPIRMGIGLSRALPFGLAIALAVLGIWALTSMKQLPKIANRVMPLLLWTSLPFLFAFVFLHWNGFWAYAQATGHLGPWWIPLNAGLFLVFAIRELRTKSRNDLWNAFIAVFAFSSLLIFKQTPRYYMIPTILAMMWISIRLSEIQRRQVFISIAMVFVAFNFWIFQKAYIQRYETQGSTTLDFRLGIFNDNGRDFRPFQKIFDWAVRNNCQDELRWMEDDRFLLPVDFLRLTAPLPTEKCVWTRHQVFFSHIPNYDPKLNGHRNEFNTPPPYPNVKFLAHFPEWGDLSLWKRR